MAIRRPSSLRVEVSSDEDEPELPQITAERTDQALQITVEPSNGDETLATQRERAEWISLPDQPKEIHLASSLKPIRNVVEAFEDLTQNAMGNGLRNVLATLAGRTIRVATMCSGTESPIVALDLIRDCLKDLGQDFEYEHTFSSEIVPWKQTWILRNFEPKILFRDITEMTEGQALTVFGEHARIPPPGFVHILVAGFACVDFSTLNNRRKDLVVNLGEIPPEQLLDLLGGESSVTLSAILKYARQYRPPILILENILGASWPQITKLLQEIDYSVGVARLDTKHFYLPQTRQRGYLIAVSNQRNDSIGGLPKASAEEAVQKWAQVLNKLIRPASSPVDEFLFKDNHPDLIRAVRDQAKEAGTQLETDMAKDWSVCWGRYQRFRDLKHLGGRAPYTQWQSGKVKPPEHVQALWLQKQPNRIKDTIDCLYLMCAGDAKRDYDASYKSRFPDASQNIDRSIDMAKHGIIGCITPNNIIFHTGKGRPPSGLELLRLQGLDSDRLLITRETQRQLKDLAGNAMSTTVIGAALIAALIAAFDAIDPSTWASSDYVTDRPRSKDKFTFDPRSELVLAKTLDFGPLDLNLSFVQFCELAVASARKCYCEGGLDQASAPINQCRDCDHTSCTDCGGNPVHDYEVLQNVQRQDPRAFIKTALKVLPTRIRLRNFDSLLHLVFARINDKIIKDKISALVQEAQEARNNAPTEPAGRSSKLEMNTRKISTRRRASSTGSHDGPFHDKISLDTPSFAEHVSREPAESVFADLLLNFSFETEEFKISLPERLHHWVIPYESEHFKLKLILDHTYVEWLLYAKAPAGLHVASGIRAILDQPIATMIPDLQKPDPCLWQGNWEARIYDPKQYIIQINHRGKKIHSWRADLGLKEYVKEKVHDRVEVNPVSPVQDDSHKSVLQEIRGSYRLLPYCGTATRALHRQEMSPERKSRSLYLFLESSPNQPSEFDEFVIARDHERSLNGDARRYLTRITTIKKPGRSTNPATAQDDVDTLSSIINSLCSSDQLAVLRNCITEDLDSVFSGKSQEEQGSRWRPSLAKAQLARLVIDHRTETFGGYLEPVNDEEHVFVTPVTPEVVIKPGIFVDVGILPLSDTAAIGTCHEADGLLYKYEMPWYGRNPNGRWNCEPCRITELNQRHMQLDLEWLTSRIDLAPELKMWNPIPIGSAFERCQICTPSPPAYVHRQMPTGGLMPMEDPEAVVRFLKFWRNKPVPFCIETQRIKDRPGRQSIIVTANLQCLLHRLLARLPQENGKNQLNLEASWRICTDVTIDRGIGHLRSLKVHDCTRENPLLYRFGSTEYSLRGDQARVFRWMLGRDTTDAEPFREFVVEESVSSHLRWSIEAQAVRTVRVRGGICADHVGFGKTVVLLATIREHMHQARMEVKIANEHGSREHIYVRATLVLVPGSLTYQWADEIEKFWSECTYLLVNTMDDLHKYSVSDIQTADIVIAAVELFSQQKNPDYTNRVAEIAGVADPALFLLPRQYTEWFKSVDEKVAAFVQDLRNDELSYKECMDNLKERSYEYRFTTAQYLDPSKRLRGKRLIADQRAQILGARKYVTGLESLATGHRTPGDITGFPIQRQPLMEIVAPNTASRKRKRLAKDAVSKENGSAKNATDFTSVDQTLTRPQSNTEQHLEPRSGPAVSKKRQVYINSTNSGSIQPPKVYSKSKDEKDFYGPTLNMFHFHRKVIDEISYVSQYQEVAIKSIPSNITWLLSGTARLRDPMDVKRLAAMIGVHTGPDDDSFGHYTEGNRKIVDDNRSDPEKIEASKVIHTEAWHKRRLLVAQTFLDRFARTNQVELPPTSRIRLEEIVYPIRLPALQAALYHECCTLLISEGFKDNVSFTGRGKHDRSMRLSFVLHNTTTVEEALIKAAFYVPRAEGYSMMQHRCHELPDLNYEQVLESRAEDVVRLARAVLRRADPLVDWLENGLDPREDADRKSTNFLLDVIKRTMWLLDVRLRDGLMDADALDQLHRLYSRYGILVSQYMGLTPKDARRRLDRLGKLVDAFVSAVRSFRFLKNAKRLQDIAWNRDKTSIIDDAGHVVNLTNVRLSGLCGHIICENCLRKLEEPICPVVGCGAGTAPSLYVRAEDLAESSPGCTFSSVKIQTTINIIKALKKDTQALIFSQWHDMNEVLVHFLDQAGVSTTYIREGEQTTAQKVAAFKNLPFGHPNWIKAMVLNPLSATAAGHNLQNVSAIIFLSPLSASSLDDYKSAYIQCIGRAARYGQKEIVKVYHLLASRTVEVNIHESRRATKLYVQEGQAIELPADQVPPCSRDLAVDNYVPQMPE